MRTALMAAIREAPEDDALRLIVADWFEEQGGEANVARAEFIRTQIQRTNLPPDDIGQSELQARELRLLKRWEPVWCGAHFVFKKVRFRRGFIEYVHLHLQHFDGA
ncbi:MAG TPA: TIGR02996 domain-containing protein [Gemmataceae bacterium]